MQRLFIIQVLICLQENTDLRRQVVLLQQQLEEKDKTIHLLQQQMVICNFFVVIFGT